MATVPSSPSSSPIADEHEVGGRVGDLLRAAEPEPGAGEAARSRTRTATARAGSPCPATPTTGRSSVLTRSCTWPNSWYATNAPARNMRRARRRGTPRARWRCRASPRTPRRTAATSRGPSARTITRIEKPHASSSGPRCFGSGSRRRPMRRVPAASSSRLSTRYAAKKMTSSTLAASPGWKFTGPSAHPEPGAVDLLPEPGSERQQQRDDADEQERVAVALERADAAHETSVSTNAPMPTAVHTACTRARSRSRREMITKPMPLSSDRDREQRRVGAGREAAHREVRDDVEPEAPRRGTPRGRRACRACRRVQQHVAGRGDHDREEPEPELAAAAAAAVGDFMRPRRRRASCAVRGRRGGRWSSCWWSSWWSWSSWSAS